ncbi:MAG: metal-dependent hydrolase [Lutibacter sp.]|uniref:metal-dependent hydrolase n=1 Tax=Lutibacter sp. TaxID=1925666 RepID=UPI0017B06BFF|nr:metal-dependent hydrolase [Lutibacter sp.]MBT8317408.1 metal-dependent hydrolase [Lutibacter sp.]NNJ58267.1 metal-dependent hydrolase [Lutibacter sp.]
MKITYLGHACISIETKDKTLLIDPFITGNELASEIDIDKLQADYILITHAHQDHILDVEAIANRTGAVIISNYEIVSHFENKGLKGHPMNHGGKWEFDFGTVHYTNAIHSSSFPDGTYGGQPGGFVIETSHHRLYIAGDTALTNDMKLIPEVIGELDLAILPVGDNFTMGIDEAIRASTFLNCNKVLGYHFDTFGYIKIDHKEAFEKFAKAKKELYLLSIGGHMKL